MNDGDLRSSDERIREYIDEHIVHAKYEVLDVIVDVSNGKVTLSGTVPHRVMKQKVEDVAWSCPGVRDVENHLNVPLTAAWPET